MTPITVKISDADCVAEIEVKPGFYRLPGVIPQTQWDRAVRRAARAGFFLVEALVPDMDPRWCMEIDPDGTEHHYLVTEADVAAFTR